MYLYHFTQITPKIRPAGPQTPCKRFTHRTNLLLWLDTHRCFLTILKRTTVATLWTLRQPGSIQQLYIIHHTKWLSCTAIHCEKIFKCKKTSRRSNLQKTEEYQVFFVLKLREIPLLSSIDRRQDRRKTGWWWWPLTSYCDVKKRISVVSCPVRLTCKGINFSRRKRAAACFLTAIGPVITKTADRKTIMNYHTRGQTR